MERKGEYFKTCKSFLTLFKPTMYLNKLLFINLEMHTPSTVPSIVTVPLRDAVVIGICGGLVHGDVGQLSIGLRQA